MLPVLFSDISKEQNLGLDRVRIFRLIRVSNLASLTRSNFESANQSFESTRKGDFSAEGCQMIGDRGNFGRKVPFWPYFGPRSGVPLAGKPDDGFIQGVPLNLSQSFAPLTWKPVGRF